MSDICYLDNSATTRPCEEAVKAVNRALCQNWGNPSSLHMLGIDAEDELISCREAIAERLSCRSDEIFFTAGGTEANNIAIRGAALARSKRGKRIVTTAFEHPSVLETVKQFELEGFEVVYLRPDSAGHISEEELRSAINGNTILVSIMLVNNELGTIQDLALAASVIKEVGAPALLHTDAVQAFGKLNIRPSSLGVDLLSASGHKIHGPKGVGFLYIKKNTHIAATLFGGGQENGIRPGTESVPLIAGLGGAVSALPETKALMPQMQELWDYARTALSSLDFVTVNSPDGVLPYILNISVPHYRSETLLHFLETKGIYVSSGSACSKGALSHTLSALSLERRLVDSALRLSFSRYTEKREIDRLCEALCEAVQKLRRTK